MGYRQGEQSSRIASPNKERILQQAAELQRQQQEIQAQLAELAELAKGLSTEEQRELQAHVRELDSDLAQQDQVLHAACAFVHASMDIAMTGNVDILSCHDQEVGADHLPDSVTALLRAAGVLHAVPLDAGPLVQADDDKFTLSKPPRFQWGDGGVSACSRLPHACPSSN